MDDDDSEQNKKTKRKKGTSNVLQRYVAYVSDVRVFLVMLYITYETLIK